MIIKMQANYPYIYFIRRNKCMPAAQVHFRYVPVELPRIGIVKRPKQDILRLPVAAFPTVIVASSPSLSGT